MNQPSAESKELAQAMREGFEHRLALGPLALGRWSPAALSSEARNALAARACLLQLPPLARPGLFARPIRLARRILKALLRPWLSVQSEINVEVLRWLENLSSEVATLRARLDPPQRSGYVAPDQSSSTNDRGTELSMLAALTAAFVHSRLPAPPAQVLIHGNIDSEELRLLGYEVCNANDSPEVSDGKVVDAVVWMRLDHESAPRPRANGQRTDALAAMSRKLRARGRLIGISAAPASLEMHGLMLVEAWRVTSTPQGPSLAKVGTEWTLDAAAEAPLLFVAERRS